MRMRDWGLMAVAVLVLGMTDVQGESSVGEEPLRLAQPEEPRLPSAPGPAASPPVADASMRPARAYRAVERDREGRSPQEERRR